MSRRRSESWATLRPLDSAKDWPEPSHTIVVAGPETGPPPALREVVSKMCGIAGIWNRDSREPVDTSSIRSMVNAIRHRGPDDEGLWSQGPLGLGHARL